jgi:hypothetical protein
MEISRRRLFQMGQACLAVAAVPEVFAAESGFEESNRRLAALSREHFTPHVGSSFAVRREESTSWIRLVAVEDSSAPEPDYSKIPSQFRPKVAPPKLDAFALRFLGPGAGLTQNTYTVEHASLGTFRLFLSPAGENEYTAVFNRIVGYRTENATRK